MPFALDNTHISGGSFNNVSGNITQVFNSQAVHVNAPVEQRLVEGSNGVRDSGINDFIGAIRGSRGHSNFRPYEIANRGNRYRPEILPNPSRHSSNNIQAGVHNTMHHVGPAYIDDGSMSIADLNQFKRSSEFPRPHYAASEPPPPTFPHNLPRTFNSVAGNMTQLNVTSHGESGLDILYRRVVVEALHDSGERFPEPACHPGTRTAVLKQLNSWSIHATEGAVMWLNGSAGIGKSAIAQMFAGKCQTQGRLGASFFFKRGHHKRGTWDGFFTTIAYQLATTIPALSLPIQQAVEADKLVGGRAMPLQFQRLILEPFQQKAPLGFLPVIVVDGLDECNDHKVQQQILCLFIDAIRAKQLPICLLICSRPEPHLREQLDTEQTSGVSRSLVLSTDRSAYKDIRSFLRDKFSIIHSTYRNRGIALGDPWPSPQALEQLVQKSSGIFVYATTVIRFVGDEYSHPADRLDRVLSLDPQSTVPLDDLYTEILSLVPQSSQNLQILHIIWKGPTIDWLLDPEEIDALLTLRPGTTRLMLRGLQSIFYVPPVRGRCGYRRRVEHLHASLGDYLGDARRSGLLCVSPPWLQHDLLYCMIGCLSSPPMSAWTRSFRGDLVDSLPQLLKEVTPSEYLFEVMRNETFQESLFLSHHRLDWPQRGSSYTSDLLELWKDHRFMSELAQDLSSYTLFRKPTHNRGAPTLKFDSIYAEILSKNPHLLSVLAAVALGKQLLHVLAALGSSYSVLRPFIEARQLLVLPLLAGDSPVDFLIDSHRSGELWNEQDSAEEMVLRWIAFAKGDDWLYGSFLTLFDRYGPSPNILRELETLNLSALCNEIKTDHLVFHEEELHPRYLLHIVNWLRRLPSPPKNVIRGWEEQMLSIKLCYNTLLRDSGEDSSDEDSDSDSAEDSDKDSDEDSNNEVWEEGGQE
ncbi:hypothetical protein DFH09DRAFT_1370715 [Mycena vulgaris]|nr:hypothetical protein DFH09DRAFT_1370715 [Mycena vulgaris]